MGRRLDSRVLVAIVDVVVENNPWICREHVEMLLRWVGISDRCRADRCT